MTAVPWWAVCQNVDHPDGPAHLIGPYSSWEEAMFDVWLAVNGKAGNGTYNGKCKHKHFIGRFHKEDERMLGEYRYKDRLRRTDQHIIADFHTDLYTGVLDRDLAAFRGKVREPLPHPGILGRRSPI